MMTHFKPMLVGAGTVLSSVVVGSLTSAEGQWLLVGLGVLAFAALLLNNALGAAQKYKQLKNGTVTPQPLSVVIEKSMAEKFVVLPRFVTLEDYIHKTHREVRSELQEAEIKLEERSRESALRDEGNQKLILENRKELEYLVRDLNKDNERRSEGIHKRINQVAEEMPGKVITLLKDTGHLRQQDR